MPSLRNTLLCAAVAAGALVAAAHAQTPAYVGKWASQPAQCRVGQEKENAPMVMRRDGYDQHEAHCKFTSVRQKVRVWAVKAHCTVEGDDVDLDLTLEVADNHLTIRDKNGASTYRRCP